MYITLRRTPACFRWKGVQHEYVELIKVSSLCGTLKNSLDLVQSVSYFMRMNAWDFLKMLNMNTCYNKLEETDCSKVSNMHSKFVMRKRTQNRLQVQMTCRLTREHVLLFHGER